MWLTKIEIQLFGLLSSYSSCVGEVYVGFTAIRFLGDISGANIFLMQASLDLTSRNAFSSYYPINPSRINFSESGLVLSQSILK